MKHNKKYLVQDDRQCAHDVDNWKPSGLTPEEIEKETEKAFAKFDEAFKRNMGEK